MKAKNVKKMRIFRVILQNIYIVALFYVINSCRLVGIVHVVQKSTTIQE